MKTKGCVVFIENKKGDFYNVVLTKEQEQWVIQFLWQLLSQKIQITRQKFPFERINNKN